MKRLVFTMLMAMLMIVLVACGSSNDTDSNTDVSDSDTTTETTEEESQSETVVVEHKLGTAEVPKNPEKVVVFDFGTLDTLDYLGIDVVGVPQTNIPSYLEKYAGDEYENVGSLKEPDFEKIAEIDPDLIIISGRQAELYDQFTELAETIYFELDPANYMESFENNATTIGEIFGKEAEVEEGINEVKESIEAIKEKAEATDEKALIILANDDKISAYGPNSRFGFIHDVLGVTPVDENIEASTHGMNISFEYVVDNDPDILYVIDRSAAVGGETSAEQLVENELVEKTKAYQNDRIYYLNPDYWYLSGGGLISVPEMIKEIENSFE